MKLADLMDAHSGTRIWIFGTGPSLDLVNYDDVTGPRILLHRAAFLNELIAPGQTYWLVLDDCWGMKTPGPWDEMLARVRDGSAGIFLVCRDPLGAIKRPVPAPRDVRIIRFNGRRPQNEEALTYTRQEVADRNVLWTWSGSAGPAVHLAWFMGAAEIMLVGCDGTDGHAERLARYYETGARSRGGFGYRPAYDCMMKAIRAVNIPCRTLTEEICV